MIEALDPTDAELEEYLKSNLARFAIDPAIAFQQIYLNPERRGDKIDQDAAAILESSALQSFAGSGLAWVTSLCFRPQLTLTIKPSIGQTFGARVC